MEARAHRPALYLRILLAWLLAMQPLVAGYSAQAAGAPFALELCRGAPVPAGEAPAAPRDHGECCLAACLGAGAPPPAQAALPAPSRLGGEARLPALGETVVRRAGLGPQAARAPPL